MEKGLKKNKNRNIAFLIKRILAGVVIGIGGIIPGVSGGIMAVSLGLYKPMLDAVSGILKNFKRSLKFLLPIAIGGIVGLLATSHLVEWALDAYPIPVMCLFVGLVAGGIPNLISEANSKGGFKKRYLFATFIGALFVFGLSLLETLLFSNNPLEFNYLTAMLTGGILAVGTVIPGISTSFILMFLGLYEPLIGTVNTVTDIPLIIDMIGGNGAALTAWIDALLHMGFVLIGVAVVGLLLVLLVKKLIETYHGYAYYAILGFLGMSMCLIFPGGAAAGMLLVFGFMASFIIDKFMNKKA